MNNFLLYSPLIGFGCFILAAVFIYVWPKSRAREIRSLNFPNFALHYFHPLGWVLVGMGVFMYLKYAGLAIVLIGLGVLAFAMFLYIWLRR
jgi:hypothetical protein